MTDRERLAQIEGTLDHLLQVIDMMATQILNLTARALALTRLVEEHGVLPPGSVLAMMQQMDLDATAEIKLGSEHEEYRRLRRAMRDRATPEEEER